MKNVVLVSAKSVNSLESLGRGEASDHQWVTVVNPTNSRLLLQACDDCGVVKSENSVRKMCLADKGRALVSGDMQNNIQRVC